MRTQKRRSEKRRGTVTVEFALTLPIVLLIFFGAFEFSRMNMLKHSIDNASYAGARKGLVLGATATQVSDEVDRLLGLIGAANADVVIDPSVIDDTTDVVTVTVTVPLGSNGYVLPKFLGAKNVVSSCSLKTERSLYEDG